MAVLAFRFAEERFFRDRAGCGAISERTLGKGSEAGDEGICGEYEARIRVVPAGTHGLAERNTYANTDREHVESSKRRLQESYPDIRFAYHSLEALKKQERSIQ